MTTDTTALDVLRKARALIEKPENWTQGMSARDSTGERADPMADAAVRFCSYGAICHSTGGSFVHPASRGAVQALQDAADEAFFSLWNDSHTHAEVIAAFDKAIASLEAA